MRFLLVLVAIAALLWWWREEKDPLQGAQRSAWGFVAVPMPDGADADTVLILTPQNCPSELAQRADSLFTALQREGIPVKRTSYYQVSIIEPSAQDREALARFDALNRLPGPIVLVRGHGSANPAAQAVIGEYSRTSQPSGGS